MNAQFSLIVLIYMWLELEGSQNLKKREWN